MKVFSITYWPPNLMNSSGSIVSVNAVEFAFTETHVLFLNAAKEPIYVIPLSLQPIVRYAGDVNDG